MNTTRKKPHKIVVTAGPTVEWIDPVRFISNKPTGSMGYEIAREARKKGFSVTLISGPVAIVPPPGASVIKVETASDMKKAVEKVIKKADCLVMAAAVCDFKFKKAAAEKIKKAAEDGVVILLITHYQRILKYLTVDWVHILLDGKLIESGGHKLAQEIEEKGYQKLK